MISTARTGDFHFTGQALSAHKNIHSGKNKYGFSIRDRHNYFFEPGCIDPLTITRNAANRIQPALPFSPDIPVFSHHWNDRNMQYTAFFALLSAGCVCCSLFVYTLTILASLLVVKLPKYRITGRQKTPVG